MSPVSQRLLMQGHKNDSDMNCRFLKRHSEGTGSYPITNLPFGLLPSVFAGDEHVLTAGVAEALLPAVQLQHQQQHQWSSTSWGGAEDSIVPTTWNDHWSRLWAASFSRDTDPSQSVESNMCQPGCNVHSEAYHCAETLVGKIIAFPANYVQQWRPEKTEEVLFWLKRQMAFDASSPSMVNRRLTLAFQPTKQDAELLRICEYKSHRAGILCVPRLTSVRSSTSCRASKRPSTEMRT